MTQEAAKIQEEMEQVRQSKETDEKAIEELQSRIDNFDSERKAAEKKSAQLVSPSTAGSILLFCCCGSRVLFPVGADQRPEEATDSGEKKWSFCREWL